MDNSIEQILAGERFTQAFPSLIRALNGDAVSALVLQAINFRMHIIRPDEDGEVWVDLRVAELADEIGLSVHQCQRAMTKLRDKQLLNERQSSGYNNNKEWQIAYDGVSALAQNLTLRNRSINSADSQDQFSEFAESTISKEVIRTNKNIVRTSEEDSDTDSISYQENYAEAKECADYLAALIEANGSKKPKVTPKWINEIRLMHTRDERSWNDIKQMIAWSQADPFWKGNILSPAKLRAKFDQMRLARERQHSSGASGFFAIADALRDVKELD